MLSPVRTSLHLSPMFEPQLLRTISCFSTNLQMICHSNFFVADLPHLDCTHTQGQHAQGGVLQHKSHFNVGGNLCVLSKKRLICFSSRFRWLFNLARLVTIISHMAVIHAFLLLKYWALQGFHVVSKDLKQRGYLLLPKTTGASLSLEAFTRKAEVFHCPCCNVIIIVKRYIFCTRA